MLTNSVSTYPIQDLDVPVAHRKAKRVKRLPKRYREDTLPESLPVASPALVVVSSGTYL